jgi:hypothetical protein
MKKSLSLAVAGLMVAACARAESAHKFWGAGPAQWSSATSPHPVIRDVGMGGPGARIQEPDPPTNGTFRASYLFKMGSTVSVQKVHMLVVNKDGTINTKEIKITPVSLFNEEVITGYYSASFSTEQVSFKEGDVFVMVFNADGETTTVFLKITYHPFVPS